MPVTSRGVSGRHRPSSSQTVEAVFEADALDAGVAGVLDHGTDDGVQAGGVAAAGEDADAGNRFDHVYCLASGQSILPTIANGDGASVRQRKLAVVNSTVDFGRDHRLERGRSWAASSVGRARRSQRRGRGFEPRAVHHSTHPERRQFTGPRLNWKPSDPARQPGNSMCDDGSTSRSSRYALPKISQTVTKSAATIGPTMKPMAPNTAMPPRVENRISRSDICVS